MSYFQEVYPCFRWHKTLPLYVSTTATRTPEKQLCRTTCITLFCAFLCRQYTISLSEINFTFYGGRKGRRRRTFFSLSEHWCYKLLRSSTTGEFAYVWQREGVGIIKLKFRMTRSHFLNNFFPAVKSGHANRISFKKKYSDTCLPLWRKESIGAKILKEFYKNVHERG